MSLFGIIGIALCGFSVSLILKPLGGAWSLYVSALTSLALSVLAFQSFSPVIEYLRELSQSTGIGIYGGIILKLTAIGTVCAIASGICSDAGEHAIASGVELVGKGAAALTVLPVLRHLVNSVGDFLQC